MSVKAEQAQAPDIGLIHRGGNRQLKRAIFPVRLCLARQRITVLFAMLRDGTFYDSRTRKAVELAA